MEEILIGLDGITFQHVAELLLQIGTTANERRRCKATYWDCLEVVAFALLMSDRIALNANLPRVGKDTPGEDLKALLGREIVAPVEDMAPANWKAKLLEIPEFNARTKSWLALLDRALVLSRTAWDHLVLREISADYLGTDAEIGSSSTSGAAAKFKAEHYIGHDLAQEAVPKKFVKAIADTIRKSFPKLLVDPVLVHEFIERMAVTHIVNYWKMNLDAEESQLKNLVRLPHQTRSSIRFTELAESNVDGNRRKTADTRRKRLEVVRCLMPFPLRHLMDGVRDREKVIQRALDLRDFPPIPHIRDRLRKVFGELEQGNVKPATKLCNEISHLTSKGDRRDWQDSRFTIGWNLDYNVPYFNASTELLEKLFRRDHYFLKQFTSVNVKQTDLKIKKLFPEIA